MIIFAPKDPGAVQKYALDFTPDLAGATITGSPTITPTGVVLDGSDVNGNLVELLLSGGTAGTVATVAVSVVSSNGETLPGLLVLPIGGEAVDLATAKAAQRIENDDEDALLAGLLRAAIGHIETVTGKLLTAKVVTQTLDGFPGAWINRACGGGELSVDGYSLGYYAPAHGRADPAIRLWKGPASAILSVKYDDENGVEQDLASFRLVEGANAKLLPAYGSFWPVTAQGPGTVRLTYIAGYDPAALPPELTMAAILLFGHWNANREAVAVGRSVAAIELPLGVDAIIAPYTSPGIG